MAINFMQHVLGSSLSLPAHGWVGARATSFLAAHFAKRNRASNSVEKKGSPSEGVAEGGGWGEEFRRTLASEKFTSTVAKQIRVKNNRKYLFSQ